MKQKYKTRWLEAESVLRDCEICTAKVTGSIKAFGPEKKQSVSFVEIVPSVLETTNADSSQSTFTGVDKMNISHNKKLPGGQKTKNSLKMNTSMPDLASANKVPQAKFMPRANVVLLEDISEQLLKYLL